MIRTNWNHYPISPLLAPLLSALIGFCGLALFQALNRTPLHGAVMRTQFFRGTRRTGGRKKREFSEDADYPTRQAASLWIDRQADYECGLCLITTHQ
jgi:hypothetical protein